MTTVVSSRDSGSGFGRRLVGGQREAALQELHDRHASELWRFYAGDARSPSYPEDVVQEVLLKAWKDPASGNADELWPALALHGVPEPDYRSLAKAASRHEQRMEDPPEEKRRGNQRGTRPMVDRRSLAACHSNIARDQRRLLRGQVGGRHLRPAPSQKAP